MAVIPRILLFWALLVSSARAQDVIPLEEGQPAPFGGLLFPDAEALRCLDLEDERDRLRLDLGECGELRAVEADAAARRLASCETARAACELDHVPPPRPAPRWYETPTFWGVSGFVLGVGAAIAISQAVR